MIVGSWVALEMKHMKLKDDRLIGRFGMILEQLSERPEASIPEALASPAKIKGAYRFFANERVEAELIREGFYSSTAERIVSHKTVLIASDKTDINCTHKKISGKGVLKNFAASGFIVHSAFAIGLDEVPLGLLDQKFFARKKEDYGKKLERKKGPIENRESFGWLMNFRNVQKRLPSNTTGIFMADREADIYDIFLEPRNKNMHLLIRSLHNRTILDENIKIEEKLSKSPVAGTINVMIKRSGSRKEREAIVEIRFEHLIIKSPDRRNLPPIELNVVLAQEIITEEVEDPIKWMLLTTVPVASFEEAAECVKWYSMRWLIERYHFTLKSGCQIEELQFEEGDRLDRALAVYCMVAWRLIYITYSARSSPDDPATLILKKEEWEALHCFVNKTIEPPTEEPTIKEVVSMLAKLGGFLGRKSDGFPGIKVIWRGLRRLGDICQSYLIFVKRCG